MGYGVLAGPAHTSLFASLLLFTGTLADNMNRKYMLCFSCLAWSSFTFMNSYASNYDELLYLRILIGGSQAFFGPPIYSIIADFFPPMMRPRAFSIYTILTGLADSVNSMTINIISHVGWRQTFQVCGGFGIIISLIGLLILYEPKRGI